MFVIETLNIDTGGDMTRQFSGLTVALYPTLMWPFVSKIIISTEKK